jgi:hypothetical protein
MRRFWLIEAELPTAVTVVSPVISTISTLCGTPKKSSAESFGGLDFFGKRRSIENAGEAWRHSHKAEAANPMYLYLLAL